MLSGQAKNKVLSVSVASDIFGRTGFSAHQLLQTRWLILMQG